MSIDYKNEDSMVVLKPNFNNTRHGSIDMNLDPTMNATALHKPSRFDSNTIEERAAVFENRPDEELEEVNLRDMLAGNNKEIQEEEEDLP